MKSIKKVAIIGVGLMGGALALALKERFPHFSLWGYARSNASYNKLRTLRIVDKVDRDLKSVIEGADLVVLASPVYVVIEFFKKIAPYLKEGSIVIDLGSTKELIQRKADRHLPKTTTFIGCHPLCGSEKSSAKFSHVDLYKGAFCIITSNQRRKDSRKIKRLWEALGQPRII